MPKQQPHNSFYYFMLDFKQRQGNKFKSMKEVADAAGPHWRNLSDAQRKVYERKAQAEKANKAKLNSDKLPIDQIEKSERQEREWIVSMKDDIQATMSIAKKSKTLPSKFFFIIHMNSFCQHEHSKEYSPCEVAIAGFSLKTGILNHNVYHSEIKPGPLPIGYANIALQHAKDTHMMPLPKVGNHAEDNQQQVFTEIIEFLLNKEKKDNMKFPTLYAAQKNIPMVKSVLKSWCDKFGIVDFDDFQIYGLQYMFTSLRNAVSNNEVWTSDTMSFMEIERDVYNYTLDIACEFHKSIDSLVFCSRSIVVRYAFIICDNCCLDANVELIPGVHVPSNSKLPSNDGFKMSKSSKKKSARNQNDGTLRVDSSDTESVSSIGKYTEWDDDTSSATSNNYSEFNFWKKSNNPSVATGTLSQEVTTNTNSRSYSGAASNSTAFDIAQKFGGISIDEETMANHFPSLNAGRGFIRGKGRGRPFRNLTTDNN